LDDLLRSVTLRLARNALRRGSAGAALVLARDLLIDDAEDEDANDIASDALDALGRTSEARRLRRRARAQTR
jgi:alkyl sulfatase BDS1-like metallo-beta-lactamase superfamily hydrolase